MVHKEEIYKKQLEIIAVRGKIKVQEARLPQIGINVLLNDCYIDF